MTESDFLSDSWRRYRSTHVDPRGFVLDRRRGNGTVTSEGQGYGMLRAVWERDEAAFETLFEWSETHLRRPDGLYSWLWSPSTGELLDENSATDGDLEAAWAMLLAAEVFDRPEFRDRAVELLQAVRTHAAIGLDDGWFPAAGNWAVTGRITNLSYFVPYAHPWFQAVDPEGSWDGVTEFGYDTLERWLQEPGHVLVPAFVRMERDGSISALAPETGLQSDFSFDAVRVFWRVEADCRLTGNARACADPLGVARAAGALVVDGKIFSHYGLDGVPKTDEESLSFYAALLPSLRRHSPEVVDPVLAPRLRGAPLEELVAAEDRYWDRNWVWFGLALDAGVIEERTPGPPR